MKTRTAALWLAVLLHAARLTAQHGPPSQPAAPAPAQSKVRKPGGGAGIDYKDYEPAQLERGKQAFVTQCGFCHGSNAKGGETGPDLVRSVLVLDDENGNLIGPVVLGSRLDKGMPKFNLPPSQLDDIVAFLHDSVRAAAERGTYKILDIVTGNAKAGETYFNGAGKCSSCHSVQGDLKGVGSKYDPIVLQGKLLMPFGGQVNQRRQQAPIQVTVTMPSGAVTKGALESIDDFSVALRDSSGNYRSWTRNGAVPRVTLNDPAKAHYDLLPKYTDADIHNLTAFLVTLK